MIDRVRASSKGLELVYEAIYKKGWRKQTPRFYEEAGTSLSTLKRFWAGKPINKCTFKDICRVAGVPWEKVVEVNMIVLWENPPQLCPVFRPEFSQDNVNHQ